MKFIRMVLSSTVITIMLLVALLVMTIGDSNHTFIIASSSTFSIDTLVVRRLPVTVQKRQSLLSLVTFVVPVPVYVSPKYKLLIHHERIHGQNLVKMISSIPKQRRFVVQCKDKHCHRTKKN
jgi:hypothetical protein